MIGFESIKGLSESRIAALNKAGILSLTDLLMRFPVRYFDRRVSVDWDNLQSGDSVAFEGFPCDKPSFVRIRRGLTLVKAKFDACGKQVWCSWFNQDYIFRSLVPGQTKLLVGRVKRFKNSIEVVAPQIYAVREQDIVPIYKLPKGIPQNVVAEVCRTVLDKVGITSYIGKPTAEKFGIMPLPQALAAIHFPKSVIDAEAAKKSIALEQLAYTLCLYTLVKSENDNKRVIFYHDSDNLKLSQAISALPFKLTPGQTAALDEIISQLKSPERMNILLQGDVGSGKTVIAFLSAYYAALSGYQCAIMAPTDILAKQHYINAIDFFESKGMRVAFLSGGQSKAERETALFNIKNGAVDIVVGTHAIISKNIEFYNLALTIVDEQHRFGVCQRGSLENKSISTDNLIMSATPIPRTLAMSVYGELKQVTVGGRPQENYNIKTAVVPERKLEDMYLYIEKKAAAGEKTYIVCPRINSEDEISATGLHSELKKGALKNLNIGLLHGQMKEAQKTAVLNEFSTGSMSVLVSTTVIEVGIDVKDATTMVIFGGDRFGLSQLHQLRGRIGRDGRESYCFLVCGDNPPDRMKYLCENSDGFALAEYDFASRGAGDFLGTRQHGDETTFAGIKIDADMIRKAKQVSESMLSDKATAAALRVKAIESGEFIKELTLS